MSHKGALRGVSSPLVPPISNNQIFLHEKRKNLAILFRDFDPVEPILANRWRGSQHPRYGKPILGRKFIFRAIRKKIVWGNRNKNGEIIDEYLFYLSICPKPRIT